MNKQQSALWSVIRSVVVMACSTLVGMGLAKPEQIDTLMSNLDVVVPGLIGIAVVVWGIYVNWSTRRVPQDVADRSDIPTVSPATGAIEPPNKHVAPIPMMTEELAPVGTPVGLVGKPSRDYAGVKFPITIPNWKLNMAYGHVRPYWNQIPPSTSNKIARAINNREGLTLTRQDFDGLPEALWLKLKPYLSYLT